MAHTYMLLTYINIVYYTRDDNFLTTELKVSRGWVSVVIKNMWVLRTWKLYVH